MNQTVVSVVFVTLLVLVANPFGLWMPSPLAYTGIAALAVVATVFAGLIRGEENGDEREVALRASAARVGYLAGVIILTGAIALSVLVGERANPWIVAALGAMVITRVISRSYFE